MLQSVDTSFHCGTENEQRSRSTKSQSKPAPKGAAVIFMKESCRWESTFVLIYLLTKSHFSRENVLLLW